MHEAFQVVQQGTPFEDEQQWLELEAEAVTNRGKALEVYQVEAKQGEFDCH